MFCKTSNVALLARKSAVAGLAALLGVSTALAAGGAGTGTNPNQHEKSKGREARDSTSAVFGQIAEAASAPFPFKFAMLAQLQKQAEYARAYLAGKVGRYSRAETDACILFLAHYEFLLKELALIDISISPPITMDAEGKDFERPDLGTGRDADEREVDAVGTGAASRK